MRYIEAPKNYTRRKNEKVIFLAGGITNCPNWQQDLVKLLDIPHLVILNPRRKNFPIGNPSAAVEQITWEFYSFQKADLISFWFSKGSLNPIVLFELGKWLVQKEKRIFIGIDPEYQRKQDVEIQTFLERKDIPLGYSLEELAKQILEYLKDPERKLLRTNKHTRVI